MKRRSMLKSVAGLGLLAGDVLSVLPMFASSDHIADPRKFGATGDGKTKDTNALQQAIDDCARAGGGTVMVSPGTYLIGTIILKSNVTLNLDEKATLLGSTDLQDYVMPDDALAALHAKDPRQDPKHLIFAFRAQNIGITGRGTIDGSGSHFLIPSGKPEPKQEDLWKHVAAWSWKRSIGISPMVELALCTNVRVEDVLLQNAVGWTLRPIACNSVLIRGVRIRNPIYYPNTDGIDPTSSQDVVISDCDVITGDDAICVKNLSPYGGDKSVCRNVTVKNCRLSTGTNGFKVGIEGFGKFENINCSDTTIYNLDTPYNQRATSGICIDMPDGGSIDGLSISRITIKNVRTPIFVRLQNRIGKPTAKMSGSLRNVTISDVTATGAILTSSITGIPGYPVQDITLQNVSIETEEPGEADWAKIDVPEKENAYPEAHMFGRLPPYGLYCRHVKNLQLKNFRVDSKTRDPRPMLTCDDADGFRMVGVTGTSPGKGEPLFDMRNVRNVSIQGCSAPADTPVFARFSGANCRDINLSGNDLHLAQKQVDVAPDVPPGSVRTDNGTDH